MYSEWNCKAVARGYEKAAVARYGQPFLQGISIFQTLRREDHTDHTHPYRWCKSVWECVCDTESEHDTVCVYKLKLSFELDLILG